MSLIAPCISSRKPSAALYIWLVQAAAVRLLKPGPMGPEPDPTIDSLRLAYERTTLAWTRTALSLIGFGFSIDKLFEAVKTPFPLGPRVLGITMIAFGLLALLLFIVQVRQFHTRYPQMPRSVAGFLAAMIGLLGIMALAAALFS